ncbi:MAG: general secretion pathway protein GspK [Candidatus Omnitrophica bacterium]|nr:general secretion pathway protein GspK [Candidatus Omnitrophota bacterium]
MPRARGQSGSLLIITLWLVAILAVLAMAIARYLSTEIKLARYRLAREQAAALARSGVYLAMQRLAQDAEQEPYDWLGDEWASAPGAEESEDPAAWVVPVTLGEQRPEADVVVTIVDEERKLPLNLAEKASLALLLGDDALAQTIVEARDAESPSNPAEDRPTQIPPYVAKDGGFVAPEELMDLPDVTPELYRTLRANTTPYLTAAQTLNLNTVTPEVMSALGLTKSAIDAVVRFRDGLDGPAAHTQDGIFTQAGTAVLDALGATALIDADRTLLASDRFGVRSETFTVVAEGRAGQPLVQVRVTAVVRRAGCADHVPAPCIVAWRES